MAHTDSINPSNDGHLGELYVRPAFLLGEVFDFFRAVKVHCRASAGAKQMPAIPCGGCALPWTSLSRKT